MIISKSSSLARPVWWWVTSLVGACLALPAPAASLSGELDGKAVDAALEELARSLRETYVFADEAESMAAAVEGRLAGGYEAPVAAEELAGKLTRDLREITPDKHLRVFVLPPEAQQSADDLVKARRRFEEQAWRQNYGFRAVQILDGNVGYLQLRKFADPSVAGEAAAAAMALLAHAEALIFDLRENQGGSPFMVQLLASYLLEESPQHLVDQYVRSTDTTRQIHSLSWVPGKRMPDVPVFVLTSSRTFSAAEGFTYVLKSLERATVVGERTAGGAHPVKVVPLGEGLAVSIPFARAINPITGTNWEGKGVQPDVETPADSALEVAYAHALRRLVETATEAGRREELGKLLAATGR